MKNEKTKLYALLGLLVLAFFVGYMILGGKSVTAPVPIPPSPTPTTIAPPLPPQLNKYGDTMISQTKDYNIVYQPTFNTHLIIVYGTPFAAARSAAETEFLTKLGVSKTDACRLKVLLSTPYFINPNEADRTYGLSFCGGN